MTLSDAERAFVREARVARLATADERGRPHAVPICFALVDGVVVTPIDEKPKDAEQSELRRVRDVEANPFVALVVDRYAEDWDELCWVQVRGRAAVLDPDGGTETPAESRSGDGRLYAAAVEALREKYDQYADHALEERPLIVIEPGHAVSWRLDGAV